MLTRLYPTPRRATVGQLGRFVWGKETERRHGHWRYSLHKLASARVLDCLRSTQKEFRDCINIWYNIVDLWIHKVPTRRDHTRRRTTSKRRGKKERKEKIFLFFSLKSFKNSVSLRPCYSDITMMSSPMTLYHSLSPIPNTLCRCIRLYSESMQHGREGKG